MFVRQQIGPQAGQIIEMPYLAAENCIACGTALRVTDEEIAEAGLRASEDFVPVEPDALPPGYRVEECEGGGYDVLDQGGRVLTREIEIPNRIAAMSFAREHYQADQEAARQPGPGEGNAGDGDSESTVEAEWNPDWRGAHWMTQVKLAKQFDASVEKKAEAVEVLEAEEARRAEAEKQDGDGEDGDGDNA